MSEAMTDNPSREESPERVRLPAPTAAPMITAAGLTLLFAGLVTDPAVSIVGFVLLVAGAVGWFKEVLPDERCETVPVEPVEAIAPAKIAVARLEVGEEFHRANLPIEIYPYSAGIKGGIAGGFVMALLAVLEGIIGHSSPWYTINILAATVMPSLARASTVTLSAFDGFTFLVALLIHAILSVLMGLLYGVLLPMVPRRPIFFGGVVAPVLWTGLIWSSLGVLNPILEQRIDWGWFFACQVAFGLTAGLVTARSERIRTMQHLPFVLRSRMEAAGLGSREHPE